jgi:hypothetical protein
MQDIYRVFCSSYDSESGATYENVGLETKWKERNKNQKQ